MVRLFLSRLTRLLGNQRGELDPGVADSGGAGDTWHSQLSNDLVVEHEGKQIPLRDHPFIRDTPDIPTLAKRAYDNHKAIGGSIKLPGKDAKPEEVVALKTKLYQAGVFKAPPESADKYEIIRPEAIPENAWSGDLVKSFREIAHKHGLTQEAVKDLIDFEGARFAGMKPIIERNRVESEGIIKTKAEQEGLTMNEVMFYGGAWLAKNVGEEGMARLKASGLADDPELAWIIAKAGRDSGEDISIVQGRSDPAVDEEYNEVRKIMSDPNHADYKRWKSGDPAILAKIDSAYRKKFGTGDVSAQGGE